MKIKEEDKASIKEVMELLYEAADKLEVLYNRDSETYDDVYTDTLTIANEIFDSLEV